MVRLAKDAIAAAASELGLPKREVYDAVIASRPDLRTVSGLAVVITTPRSRTPPDC